MDEESSVIAQEEDKRPIFPLNCPICGIGTNYIYIINEVIANCEARWYRCDCGVIFQENFPLHKAYDYKYFENYSNMKEGNVRLTHSAKTYANLIEELTYGRMMLDVGYCVPHNMEFFKNRGWLTWGIDINENIGGDKNLYRGDFTTFDFDIRAGNDQLKELAQGDKFKRTFDLIWMNHSFEHFNYPQEALRKAHDLLADNGVLFIAVPNIDFIQKTSVSGYPHFKKDEHYILWSERALKREVEAAGFNTVMIRRNFSSRYSAT